MRIRYLDWREGAGRLEDRLKLLRRLLAALLVQEDGNVPRALEILEMIAHGYRPSKTGLLMAATSNRGGFAWAAYDNAGRTQRLYVAGMQAPRMCGDGLSRDLRPQRRAVT